MFAATFLPKTPVGHLNWLHGFSKVFFSWGCILQNQELNVNKRYAPDPKY
jgi:hypothetical protein